MKSKLLFAVVLLIVIAIAIYLMISNDSKAATFTVNLGNLEIKSSFGITVKIADMIDLDLKGEMPVIGKKTNGSGLGSKYKGEFTFSDGTKARLYADSSKPPFIRFSYGDTVFYINTDTPQSTQELYEQLKAEIK